MLANIFKKLNAERRIILQKFLIDKRTFSAILNTDVQLAFCRCESHAFHLIGDQQNSYVSSLSKNIARYNTNLASEKKENNELFATVTLLPRTYLQTQLPDDEVQKLLKLDWTSLSTTEFLSNLEKLTLYTYNLEKKPEINYDNFMQALSAVSSNFHDYELIHLLKYLVPWYRNKNTPKDVMKHIIETLDLECCNRLPKQNIENLLSFSYLFVCLRYGKESNFTRKSLLKLNQKSKRMSPSQLAQYMNLTSACTNLPMNFYEIEYYVEKNMDSMSAHELSRISIGFYKNRIQIKSPKLLMHILETMVNNVEVISTHMVSAFSKLIRTSYKHHYELDNLLRQVLKELQPQLSRFTLKTLTHISHLAAHAFIYEKGLMTSIYERLDEEIENATITDIERISLSLAHFNYDSSYPLYKKIVDEITSPGRHKEIQAHRRTLSRILKYWALADIYPIKLLEQIMDPEFIKETFCSKYAMNEEYFFLDQCIAAEVPNYTGPRLADGLREFLAKRHKAILYPGSRNSLQSNAMKEIISICQRLLKTECGIFTEKILPHFTGQDIIICLDEQNNPVLPEKILSTMRPDSVKPVPNEAKKLTWFSIIITTKNQVLKDSNEFSGILTARYRQLKSLGYTPVVVSHHKWYDMKTHEDCEKLQENYVKTLLNIA
ncbi:uncharacterized protein LOC117169332 [Belonocnema kinseyi]|uniref:uncharacterized protein LOC117169332 n=1 Tax=Belonocnema kinseyi TaxID=2817044 RepID=UPI00143CE5DA|nr:uncharacterized protein LOC117169332 [Belonocnema kinseyi]